MRGAEKECEQESERREGPEELGESHGAFEGEVESERDFSPVPHAREGVEVGLQIAVLRPEG